MLKRVILVAMLVLIARPAWAFTVLFFDGFEPGDLSAWNTIQGFSAISSTVHTGAYAAQTTTQGNFFFSPTFAGGTTAAFRIYVNLGTFSASLSGATAVKLVTFGPSWEVDVVTDGSANPSLQLFNGQTSLNIGSACAVTSNAWHDVEGTDTQSASVGVLGLKIDGTVCANGTSLNTGTGNITNLVPQDFPKSGTPTANVIFDDAIAITGTAYPGPGGTIARSVNSTTTNVWTPNGQASVYLNWNDTPWNSGPHGATDYNVSGTSTQKQTGPLDWTITNAAGSSGHGAQILHLADTVNAAKVGAHGCSENTSGDAVDSLVFINSAASETDMALGANWSACAGGYQETNITSVPTAAQTIGSSAGAIHAANTINHRIHALWMMIDYTVAAVVAPKGSVILP